MARIFLATANVGSVFENTEAGLPIWINEVISTVQTQNPDFVALHFQETGGKDYTNGSPVIQSFFSVLVESLKVIGFQLVQGFIDSNSDLDSEWTALSNVYFVREAFSDVQTWDFKARSFVTLQNVIPKILAGDELSSCGRHQKDKFPLHFFPNMKWSRKGFLRTRWRVQGTTFDLVNVHLFHDLSNLTAASACPSPFAMDRQRGLNYMLENFKNDDLENHPIFIFGDFNFRVNSCDLIEHLRKEPDGAQLVFDVKKFEIPNFEERFKYNWAWLKPYDFEVSHFEGSLSELEVKFHPSYPFDEESAEKFMRTRCPSWCDRVLFTPTATDIISKESHTEYNVIGSEVCMGDHKPVYLSFELKSLSSDPNNGDCLFQPDAVLSNGVSEKTPSGNPKPKCRIVSFLRGNLSFTNNVPSRSSSRNTSMSVSSTHNLCRTKGRPKCCFVQMKGKERLGTQNMVLSTALGETEKGRHHFCGPSCETSMISEEETRPAPQRPFARRALCPNPNSTKYCSIL